MKDITFITPSIGRATLQSTINSLNSLTRNNWRHIIIFDGVEPTVQPNNRTVVLQVEKEGRGAGIVRNHAFDYVDTEWIGFVDDDDMLSKFYIERMEYWLNQVPDLDIIIFAYKDLSNGNVQPRIGTRDFVYCQVGISFAVRTDFVMENNIRFRAGGIEDFYFLDECRNAGAKYIITNEVQYYVSRRGVWK